MNRSRFVAGSRGPTPLFLDTSGLVAYYDPSEVHHGAANRLITGIANGEFAYRGLFTNDYVVDELLTVLHARVDHDLAIEALRMLDGTDAISVLRVPPAVHDEGVRRFERYRDWRELSVTDLVVASQMERREVDHVFALDDDFRKLGFDRVPRFDLT